MIKFRQKGDTLVEVMLSMAVIGMVIGTSYAISNRATQLGRLGQQRTQINNLMRAQAEYLKLFRNNNSPQWHTITVVNPQISSAPTTPVNCSTTTDHFYINSSSAVTAGAHQDPTGLYNIWIVPYKISSDYSDYYIIGCWRGPGNYGQQQSFIVERLNNSL